MKMRTMTVLATVAVLGFLLTSARAEDQPDATIKLHGGSVAVGIGYSWGGGTLTYKGKTYEVEVKGLSVGDVGATDIQASATSITWPSSPTSTATTRPRLPEQRLQEVPRRAS